MTRKQLTDKTVTTLKRIAEKLGLRGVTKLRKADLINAIAEKSKAAPNAAKPTAKRTMANKETASTDKMEKTEKAAEPSKAPAHPVSPKPVIVRRRKTEAAKPAIKSAAPKKNGEPEVAAPEALEYSAHKFDLRLSKEAAKLPPPPPHEEDLGELPDAYGTGKVFLTARDPHWLYAYWDLTPQQMIEIRAIARDHRVILRLYESGYPHPSQEIPLHRDSRDWYLFVGKAGAAWRAQLGYYKHDGSFAVISESGRTVTPRDALGSDGPARFVTIPADWSLEQLFKFVRSHARAEEKLADVLHRLQMAGFRFPFKVSAMISEWTSEQERAIYQMVGGAEFRRIRAGSLDFSEWLHRRLLEEIGSGSVSSFSLAKR